MHHRWRSGVAVLCVFLLCFQSVPGTGVAGATTDDVAGPTDAAKTVVLIQQPAVTNATANETEETPSRHEREFRDDRPGYNALLAWYVGRLGGRLQQGTINLSQGQYERAREILGSDYNRSLARYVNVAGETETREDDQIGEVLKDTQEQQRDLTNVTESFEKSRTQYQETQESSNQSADRTAAREARRQAREVRRLTAALIDRYRALDNRTRLDFEEEIALLLELRAEAEVVIEETNEVFEPARLSATVVDRPVSFETPLHVRGRLTDQNGTGLASRRIQLELGNATAQTRTNGSGYYEVRYRPITTPTGQHEAELTYRPRASANYTRATTTASVRVVPVEPTLTVTLTPSAGQFWQEYIFTGQMTVNGTAVPNAPLALRHNQTELWTTQTNADGRFTLTRSLPVTLPTGDRQIRVRFPLSGRAVNDTETSTALRIRETVTTLTATAIPRTEGTFTIRGRLRMLSANRQPVPSGQQLLIRLDDSTITTVRTNETGHFERTVTPPSEFQPAPGENITRNVTIAYTAASTSLAPARNTTTINLTRPEQQGLLDTITDPITEGPLDTLADSIVISPLDILVEPLSVGPLGYVVSLLIFVLLILVLYVAYTRIHSAHRLTSFAVLHAWVERVMHRVRGVMRAVSEQIDELRDFFSSLRISADDTPSEPTDSLSEIPEIETIMTAETNDGSLTVLEHAQSRLTAGQPEIALKITYAVVRYHVSQQTGLSSSITNRQFYKACAEHLDDETTAILLDVTDAYEQTVYNNTLPTKNAIQTLINRTHEMVHSNSA